jgi:protein-disulfide isomerase
MRATDKQFWLVLRFLIIIAAFSLGVWVVPAFAQLGPGAPSETGALKGELEQMKTALDNITKELELMKQAMSQRLSPSLRPQEVVAHVSLSGRPMLGNPEAPLTLIEFSDYQCPYCRRFVEATLPALKTEYIDTGKLRYVFRDFPLDRLHPQARKAAEAAHCAGEQGRYWAMHDVLFQHQNALAMEQLQVYAQGLGLDATAFEGCLQQGIYTAAVQQDLEEGTAAGVQGTPGFFLGKTRADEAIQGTFIRGAQPITAFRQAIEHLLLEQP